MLISEITSPDLRPSNHPPSLDQVLTHLETLITHLENNNNNNMSISTLSPTLRHVITALLTPLSPSLTNAAKLHLWKLAFRLWNTLVDLSNSGSPLSPPLADLRLCSADILSLSLSSPISGVPSPFSKTASFYFKTALLYLDLRNLPLASKCLENATDLLSKLTSLESPEERKLSLDVAVARARVSWEGKERSVAVTLLNRAKRFLFDDAESFRALSEVYVAFGKDLMKEDEERERSSSLMSEGLELCEKGMRCVRTKEETMSLRLLRDKTLRFIAALHLQREEYDSVLKCVRVLRERCSDEHPSLSVMAMKAWLGKGRSEEAERELREMVGREGVGVGVPEGVWVGAVEEYFKAVGVAGVETVKGVFLGLLGRCRVSAGAAVRVIYRVVGDGGGGGGEGVRLREKIAGELAGDERVVKLFGGDGVGKERTGLHAVLWNW